MARCKNPNCTQNYYETDNTINLLHIISIKTFNHILYNAAYTASIKSKFTYCSNLNWQKCLILLDMKANTLIDLTLSNLIQYLHCSFCNSPYKILINCHKLIHKRHKFLGRMSKFLRFHLNPEVN